MCLISLSFSLSLSLSLSIYIYIYILFSIYSLSLSLSIYIYIYIFFYCRTIMKVCLFFSVRNYLIKVKSRVIDTLFLILYLEYDFYENTDESDKMCIYFFFIMQFLFEVFIQQVWILCRPIFDIFFSANETLLLFLVNFQDKYDINIFSFKYLAIFLVLNI